MTQPKLSDEAFIECFEIHGASHTSRQSGASLRNVFARRANLEKKIGRQIKAPAHNGGPPRTRVGSEKPTRLQYEIESGTVLVGSDAHYWPGIITTAHRGLVKFAKELRPKIIVMNGDVFDGAQASRHPPIGWEDRPTLQQEIEACQERLGEIETACKSIKIWPLGNHDGRFETRLATVAPEYARVHGMHLKDHFGAWEPCWSVWINDVVIKHRYKGGLHAVFNNTVYSGKSMVTGHLHSLKVTPFTDYNGTRYGIDTGTLAEPFGDQFEYMEDGPRNWRSGFSVLTFHKGKLLWPEVVPIHDAEHVEWRGELIRV